MKNFLEKFAAQPRPAEKIVGRPSRGHPTDGGRGRPPYQNFHNSRV